MADQTQFKHIKVNAAADDDVVIYAGVHAPVQNSDTPEQSLENCVPVKNAKPKPDKAVAGEDTSVKSKDTYHETTLSDIEDSKMPTTQKVVIAVAVAAILIFVVWYMFFH